MKMHRDIAIVGSGFGGSLLAMIARRLGRSVVLLERGRHPRFAIGESSTPLANLLLEDLARRYNLPGVAPLAKYGTWQASLPNIACGLKRGFSFFHHELGLPWADDASHRRQFLVAASPHDRIADTHWYRPDFDHHLVRQAIQMEADYLDEVALEGIQIENGSSELRGRRHGQSLEVEARWVVDATGPRGWLHRTLGLPEQSFPGLPNTQGLFSHFANVPRWEQLHPTDQIPPFPVDDAAVHHVFEGGWIWVLRFNNGLTSAGVAATERVGSQFGFADGEKAWSRLLRALPSVEALFADAPATIPFCFAPKLSFRSATVAGPGWVLLPSAAGFVDPLLSTGFALNLMGIARLADQLEQHWGTTHFDAGLLAYATDTLAEVDTAAKLVAALYAHMSDFELFTALSRLYFAAVSFTETVRRLGKPDRAGPRFLLSGHPSFSPAFNQCCTEAIRLNQKHAVSASARSALLQRIQSTIAPVDVAGLSQTGQDHWHPVRAEALYQAKDKLGVQESEITAMLDRCGFWDSHSQASNFKLETQKH